MITVAPGVHPVYRRRLRSRVPYPFYSTEAQADYTLAHKLGHIMLNTYIAAMAESKGLETMKAANNTMTATAVQSDVALRFSSSALGYRGRLLSSPSLPGRLEALHRHEWLHGRLSGLIRIAAMITHLNFLLELDRR